MRDQKGRGSYKFEEAHHMNQKTLDGWETHDRRLPNAGPYEMKDQYWLHMRKDSE